MVRRLGLLVTFILAVMSVGHAQEGQLIDSNGVSIHFTDRGDGEPGASTDHWSDQDRTTQPCEAALSSAQRSPLTTRGTFPSPLIIY